jgi:hypothetical protein
MHSDFSELLRALSAHGVRYLVVGGYAVMEYTEPRYTKDLDVWIARDRNNADAVYQALCDFGAPVESITAEDFTQEGIVYQIGVSPVRVDLLTSITGVEFDDAWTRRTEREVNGLTISILSREDLIRNKRATGRPQDRLDARRLEAAGGVDRPKVPKRRRRTEG